MIINSRDLTQDELQKVANFYVEDSAGLIENFNLDEALKELNEDSSLLKAFDLKEGKVLVSRVWFVSSQDDVIEKAYEEYVIDGDKVEVVTELDWV